jgi:hypothetical protein
MHLLVFYEDITDYSFDLKSEIVLLSSVLRSAIAEAYITVPVPCILTNLGDVSSHLFEVEVSTTERCYQMI